jgi:hypothetical protein
LGIDAITGKKNIFKDDRLIVCCQIVLKSSENIASDVVTSNLCQNLLPIDENQLSGECIIEAEGKQFKVIFLMSIKNEHF